MAQRLSTGLAGLDAQLGGGVPRGTLHVLVGEPMNALELFCHHFAAAEPGTLYVSTDLDEGDVRAGARAVGGRGDRLRVAGLGQEKDLPPFAKTRYVLDSFSSYATRVGFDHAYQQVVRLKDQVRQTGTTALVTAIQGLQSDRETALLRLLADGAFELGFDRQGFGLYPYLKVTKMRGVPDSARFLLFKETAKGLFMESTRRVF